jgi:histone-lysine N-methyltransferase SETMAR
VGSFGKSIPSSHLQAANPRNLTGNFYTAPSAASSSTQTLQIEAIHENLTVVECSPFCPCAARCANRVSQRGPRWATALLSLKTGVQRSPPLRARFVVQPTSTGLGLFYDADTTLALARGSFVCLYAGEYLTTAEARARWAKGLEDNYTLSLKMSHSSSPTSPEVNGAEGWDGTIHIDPRRVGNIGRFLNHSCEPNCVIYLIKWGAGNTWPRAAIFVGQTARVRLPHC